LVLEHLFVTRDLAIVQTAKYDAVNAIDHTFAAFLVQPATAPADASPVAAADAAAFDT
jgi:hypothetical protein